MKRISKICLCILTLLASHAHANSEKNAKGAYVNIYGGPFVYKSDTVNGTDFANYTAFEVGANYGKRKEIGLAVHLDTMETEFRQSLATVKTEFTEFRLNYRNLWFLPTVYIGQGQLKATSRDPAIGELADIMYLYTGAGLDLEMPYSNTITTAVRVRSANFTAVYDKTGRDASMSAKNEFDIGIRFQLPISVVVVSGGYLHRSFALDLNGGGAAQQVQTGPYAGFIFGTDF